MVIIIFNFKIIINENKKKSAAYKMYVRDLSLNLETKIHKKLDNELKKKKKIIKKIFYGINFSVIDVNVAYKIMIKDLKKNKKIVYTKKIKART